MTRGPVEDYLSRLERELRQRGLVDSRRIVEEAREHLVDAVESGQRRGLSVEDAERQAFERFGAADTVAAHVVPEGDLMVNRFVAVLETVWRRKWWILAPTVLTAVVTSVMSYYFLPTRYRSESVIRIVSPRVPVEVHPAAADRSRAQFEQISRSIFSRTRLERIIRDFGLYQVEQRAVPLSEVALQMQRDIRVSFINHAGDADAGAFNVSFISADPTMAMKITERLASLIIEENLRETELETEGTIQFIESQIADVRRRIIAYENTLEELRAQDRRRPLSRADLLPYEVLQERYKELLVKGEESRITANVRRSQVGEKYVVIDPARLPEALVGPRRLGVNVAGALAGLGLGLLLVCVRSRAA